MNRTSCLLLVGSVLLLLFAAATGVKHFINELDVGFYNTYNGPTTRSVSDAAKQDLLVAEFRIDPLVIATGDKKFEFKEAWLEAAFEPRHQAVWISTRPRCEWSYLCVRFVTSTIEDGFHFRLAPQFPQAFQFDGLGSKGNGLTYYGGGLNMAFQKAPTDLGEMSFSVTWDGYGKGKGDVGTVRLTRIEK